MVRKVYLFILVTVALIITSCQQIDLSQFNSDSGGSSARGQLVVSCDFSQNISEFNSSDAARSNVASISDVAYRIEYIILKDGRVVLTREQVLSDDEESFGQMQFELDPGMYKLVIFAHKSDDAVQVGETGLITPPHNRVTDSYSYSADVIITQDNPKYISPQLSRCVTKMVINSDDTIPSEVNGLALTISGVSTTFDGANQCGILTQPVVKDITDMRLVTDTLTHHLHLVAYLFLPKTATTERINSQVNMFMLHRDYTLQKTDTLMSRMLSGVQLCNNTITSVNAMLFSTNKTNLSVMVDTAWNAPINIELK